MTDAPDRDGVKEDGEGRVGDAGDAGHDGLGDVLALEGGGEVAAGKSVWKGEEILILIKSHTSFYFEDRNG